jgi:hypothetical protein
MGPALRTCATAAAAIGAGVSVAAGATASRPPGMASAHAAGAAQPPRATLTDPICRQAGSPLNRAVAITAVMRSVAGTGRMQLEFILLQKPGRRRSFHAVRGGDLGKWISPSNPTLGQLPADQWILRKQVVNLAGPAVYRFHVGFRWIDSHGHLLGSEFHWAPPCQQA